MGAACICASNDVAVPASMEDANSKFFYYSDPQMLEAFQDKLKNIQRNIEAQKKQRKKPHIEVTNPHEEKGENKKAEQSNKKSE